MSGCRFRLPARGLVLIDLAGFGLEEGRFKIALDGAGQTIGIGDDAVAHAKCTLGRLDQPMDVMKAFGLFDREPFEQGKQQQ
jgi:hypothetical protein